MSVISLRSLGLASVLMSGILASDMAKPCTRAVYLVPDDRILTGRSMDWKVSFVSNMWAFPGRVRRDGLAGDRSATWGSRYGSLIVSGYDKQRVHSGEVPALFEPAEAFDFRAAD